MNKIITFLFCLSQFIINAQHEECGIVDSSDPHFDPIAFEKYTSQYNQNSIYKFSDKDTINIAVHIIRDQYGHTFLRIDDIINELIFVNNQWEDTGIFFTICDYVNYIDSFKYSDLNASDRTELSETYNVDGAVNIFFAPSLYRISGGERQGLCGLAVYPWSSNQKTHSILMQNGCTTNGSTLSHELGHFFGLYHTHRNGNELVNGSYCSTSGDNLCDTPADPTLSFNSVTTGCIYTGDESDSNGDKYIPDTRNIMSYSRKSCRVSLSTQQLVKAAYYKDNERSYLIGNVCQSPDLSIYNDFLTESYQGGETIKKTLRVINLSLSPSTECILVSAVYDRNDKLIIDPIEYEIQAVPAEGRISIDIEFDLPIQLSTGEYYMKHTIDFYDDVAEVDNDNNILIDAFEIDNSKLNDFVLYQSIDNSQFRIFLRDEFRETHFLRVYNFNGQLIMAQEFEKKEEEYHNEYSLPGGLNTGVYLVTVWNPQYEDVRSVKFLIP